MFITALCPTYRRPALVANTLWLWEQQTHPADHRHLLIFDDGGTFFDPNGDPDSQWQIGKNWAIVSAGARFPSLMAKYNWMMKAPPAASADAILVWDDDDIYLPGYVAAHARCLERYRFSKPSHILSDYTGRIEMESGAGRFWSSMGIRREVVETAGGFPDTPRADFDQRALSAFSDIAGKDQCGTTWGPEGPHEWVYGWRTGHPHAQHTMSGPGDDQWYHKQAALYQPVQPSASITPAQDERTKRIFAALGR
jgi:hypothetical protein